MCEQNLKLLTFPEFLYIFFIVGSLWTLPYQMTKSRSGHEIVIETGHAHPINTRPCVDS